MWTFIASVEMVTKRSDATRFHPRHEFFEVRGGTLALALCAWVLNSEIIYPLVEMDGLLTNTRFFPKGLGDLNDFQVVLEGFLKPCPQKSFLLSNTA